MTTEPSPLQVRIEHALWGFIQVYDEKDGRGTEVGVHAPVHKVLDAVLPIVAGEVRAQADRVRALHRPQTLTSLIDDDCANEMCDHEDYCPTDSTAVVCAECDRVAEVGSPYYGENGVGAALYPCPTIRALDG